MQENNNDDGDDDDELLLSPDIRAHPMIDRLSVTRYYCMVYLEMLII